MKRLVAAWLVAALPALAQTPAAAPAQEGWLPRGTAELVLLDKVRAQPSTVQIRVGQSAAFGSLTIMVRSCVVRPPDVPADSAAFLEVTDSHKGGPGFRGWMLANTPAVAQFEHPLYDMRLIACR